MRRFLILAHEVPTDPSVISLSDLPGTGGRLDVIARAVTTALLLSHGIREDVQVDVVIGDELAVQFDGATLSHLHPDERSTAALLRDAIAAGEDAVGTIPSEPHEGVSVYRRDLEGTLETVDGQLVQLHEAGDSLVDAGLPDEPTLVLSDHRPFSAADESALEAAGADQIRLGPRAVHTSHAIAIAHHYLDTDGYEAV